MWDGETYHFETASGPDRKLAVIGARACELAALGIHDTVLAGGEYVDSDYVLRRADSFIVSVDCTEPGEVCFCASMGTGPAATSLFDLAITELRVDGEWEYVGRYGSERGEAVLDRIAHRQPDQIEVSLARSAVSAASDQMGRELDTRGLPEYLASHREHPHWAEIAQRCLACGNCTQACPTCFCVSTVDTSSLDGNRAEHRGEVGLVLLPRLLVHGRGTAPLIHRCPISQVAHPQALGMGRAVRHIGMCRLRPMHHVVSGRNRLHRRDPEDDGARRCLTPPTS